MSFFVVTHYCPDSDRRASLLVMGDRQEQLLGPAVGRGGG